MSTFVEREARRAEMRERSKNSKFGKFIRAKIEALPEPTEEMKQKAAARDAKIANSKFAKVVMKGKEFEDSINDTETAIWDAATDKFKILIKEKNPAIAVRRSPLIATMCSVVFPGIGQLYNREPKKGLLLGTCAFISLLFTLVAIGALPYIFLWVYGVIDAYKTCTATNVIADQNAAQ